MSHDYVVQLLIEARAADFQAEASRRRLVREASKARKALARVTAPSVLSFRRGASARSGNRAYDDRDAA